jgi:hypothetical protein
MSGNNEGHKRIKASKYQQKKREGLHVKGKNEAYLQGIINMCL